MFLWNRQNVLSMITRLRIMFFVLVLICVVPEGRGQILRKEHEYLWKGQESIRQSHWLDVLESIAKYVPSRDTSYFKSLIYLSLGHRVQAKKSIKRHQQVANHHYAYESIIIQGLASSNVYYEAFGCFSNAINLNPKRVEAYIEKVKVLADQKDYLSGIDHANEAIRLFPDYHELFVFRGNLYISEGLRKRAFKDFKRVIDAENPLSDFYMAQAHRGLAWSYLGKDDIVHAEIHLQESRVLEPKHPLSQGILAEIQFMKGDAQGAIEAYEKIVGTENKANYHMMIGLAHEELNEIEKACGYFDKCCRREISLACKKVKELNCDE